MLVGPSRERVLLNQFPLRVLSQLTLGRHVLLTCRQFTPFLRGVTTALRGRNQLGVPTPSRIVSGKGALDPKEKMLCNVVTNA